MADYTRNPTETVSASDSVSRASSLERSVGETPLADNPDALTLTQPVYLIEESV